ncbi:MAG: ABC transporter ATP-binding protein [Pseudobdellovibrionaceae bacterium]
MAVDTPTLQVKNLQTTFATRKGLVKAIQNVSYDLFPGKTLGVVGESGCGKSVTSYSIMRLIKEPGKVSGGEIWFQSPDSAPQSPSLPPSQPGSQPRSHTATSRQNLLQISESAMQDIRGRHIAMIFQEPMTALNPLLTIGQQIDEQILRHERISSTESKQRSVDMLNQVGIPSPSDRYNSYPHQLSGGMRQRAMIAMALSCNPDVLIADEPTTALDVTIQAQILELFENLQSKFNTSIQFITHDLGVISELSDDVMVMYAGHVCEKTSSENLFSNPKHPYTAALLESRPRRGQKHTRLKTIEGTVPALHDLPPGCPFANRCSRALAECSIHKPLLTNSTHAVACWNPL